MTGDVECAGQERDSDLAGNGQADAGDYFELLARNTLTSETFTPGVSYTFMVLDQLTGNYAGQIDFVGE